jgi:cytochrome c biogenesis protein
VTTERTVPSVDDPTAVADPATVDPSVESLEPGTAKTRQGSVTLPSLRPHELARWAWRQLTSMRTALFLLFLLALAAVPGSLVPQTGIDPVRVARFKATHPGLTPWYERLSLFDVYKSPWFAAIYLLLFVSLAGCVLPRSRQHWRALRAKPPPAPRNLARLPAHVRRELDEPDGAVLARAGAQLRASRWRVLEGDGWVAAEKGMWKETGNLVFHVALVLLLAAIAVGNLWTFKATVIVVEGEGFSDTVPAFDTIRTGAAFRTTSLPPFSLKLDQLDVSYETQGDQRGAPRGYDATVSYTARPGGSAHTAHIKVNHPLVVDGSKIFLTGNGYAPVFTVRDGKGQVAFSGAVPFLPRDSSMTSAGVVKVPGAEPTDLGFQAIFLPTAPLDASRGPVSAFPAPLLPRVLLNAWTGDLGLGSGVPQSVYELDTTSMRQVMVKGVPLTQGLGVGETMTLPDGQGSITFDGVHRFANFQVSRDPGNGPALLACALALGGLMLSLFVRRRRVWVRAAPAADGRTVVDVAGLARTDSPALAEEVDQIAGALGGTARQDSAPDGGDRA